MHKTVLFFLALVILCAGCVSLSTFQTARVLQENESQFGAAASTNSNYTLIIEEEDGEVSSETITGGTLEAFYRASIGSNFDIGMKAYFVGVIIDGKYQFHDGERFDMAADFGIGYNQISIDDSDFTILDFYPTLLMTFDLSKDVDLTFAPKIIARFISGPTENSTLVGGTMMLRFGPLMPEIGYYVSEGDNIVKFGVGMNLNR